MPLAQLVDAYGRTARKLRISVTDRCNLRCLYCLPEEPAWLPRAEILSFEEIERVARVLVGLGVEKVRLTGGEPLVRTDVQKLAARLALIPGLKGLTMTTNGLHLDEKARPLKEAGLTGLTVSLDALDPETYTRLVRRDALSRVLKGLDSALAAGFSPLKINMVVMRGANDEAVAEFAQLARSGPYIVRFIEFMPLDSGGTWTPERVVTAKEILERVNNVAAVEPVPDQDAHDPARRYRFRDGRGEVGIIAAVSEPFCAQCDRIRLTADGRFLNCLFGHVEYDVRSVLRGGGSDDDIAAVARRAVGEKGPGHLINRPGFIQPRRPMVAIGG